MSAIILLICWSKDKDKDQQLQKIPFPSNFWNLTEIYPGWILFHTTGRKIFRSQGIGKSSTTWPFRYICDRAPCSDCMCFLFDAVNPRPTALLTIFVSCNISPLRLCFWRKGLFHLQTYDKVLMISINMWNLMATIYDWNFLVQELKWLMLIRFEIAIESFLSDANSTVHKKWRWKCKNKCFWTYMMH